MVAGGHRAVLGRGGGNLNKETLKDRESAPAGGETRSQGAGLGGSLLNL